MKVWVYYSGFLLYTSRSESWGRYKTCSI